MAHSLQQNRPIFTTSENVEVTYCRAYCELRTDHPPESESFTSRFASPFLRYLASLASSHRLTAIYSLFPSFVLVPIKDSLPRSSRR